MQCVIFYVFIFQVCVHYCSQKRLDLCNLTLSMEPSKTECYAPKNDSLLGDLLNFIIGCTLVLSAQVCHCDCFHVLLLFAYFHQVPIRPFFISSFWNLWKMGNFKSFLGTPRLPKLLHLSSPWLYFVYVFISGWLHS